MLSIFALWIVLKIWFDLYGKHDLVFIAYSNFLFRQGALLSASSHYYTEILTFTRLCGFGVIS
jgi:hypothetical protein